MEVIVYLDFRVLGELEREGFEVGVAHAWKYHREREADDIIKVHDETDTVALGQCHEPSARFGRELNQSVVGLHLRSGQFDGHVDVAVALVRELTEF